MLENRAHWADKAFWWVAPIVIVASAAGGAYYYFHSRKQAVEPEQRAVNATPQAAPKAAAGIQHPIPGGASKPEAPPLPALNESDPSLLESLEQLLGDVSVKQILVPEDIVRHAVVTIDNLPRQKVAVEKRPLKSIAGQTQVATQGDTITLTQENFARYAPYLKVVRSMDTRALADLYFQFYPLFQQAYEDLGYPGQYFNDRLVETIDSLLATPDVTGPIALVQPRVFYEFADPKLEALPAGQKVLLRMGRENATAVKAKLRELRDAVTQKPLSGASASGIASPPQGGLRHWL
jgi:hypothetical protein